MSAVLSFWMGSGHWAVDVRHARRVLAAPGNLRPLPSPLPGVAGLLEDGRDGMALPVLAPGSTPDGGQVIVLEAADRTFGLLVSEVVGVLRDEQVQIGPAPDGQEERLVTGVVETPTGTALLLDAEALAARLEGA